MVKKALSGMAHKFCVPPQEPSTEFCRDGRLRSEEYDLDTSLIFRRAHQAGEPRTKKSPDSRGVLALAEGESPAPSFAEMPDSEAKSMSWMHRYAAML